MIDSSALDGLQCATAISDFIKTSSSMEEDQDELSNHLPFFIWTIRDHHLELKIDEKLVTAEVYLEDCLKPKTKNINSNFVIQYNGLRNAIKSFFPERMCFVFPPPTGESENWNYLEKLTEEELSVKFKNAGHLFTTFVKQNGKEKKINGKSINGRTFGILAKEYIKAVLAKNICIESTYAFVASAENRNAVEEAIKQVQTKLFALKERLPLSVQDLHILAKETQERAIKTFLDASFNIKDHPGYQVQVEEAVIDLLAELNEENDRISRQKCERALLEIFSPISQRIKEGEFAKPGGYKVLEAAVEKVREQYFALSEREQMGPQISAVLLEMEKSKVFLFNMFW